MTVILRNKKDKLSSAGNFRGTFNGIWREISSKMYYLGYTAKQRQWDFRNIYWNMHQTSMEPPWNLHGTCIIHTIEPISMDTWELGRPSKRTWKNQCNLHQTSMEPPWNLHWTSMEPTLNKHNYIFLNYAGLLLMHVWRSFENPTVFADYRFFTSGKSSQFPVSILWMMQVLWRFHGGFM